MENSGKLVSQSNMLTESRIEYTELERNIFYMVLSQISKEPKEYYYVSVKEMMEKTGSNNNYAEYSKATERLRNVGYEFKRPENGNILQVGLLASIEYLKGQGLIEIELSKKIIPYFFELKNRMTIYQIDVALSLNSKYSKRLYEILSQWKNVGEKTFDLLDLKRMLNLYNPKTGEEEYKDNITLFKAKVLDIAKRDLNKVNSDITFDYKANKFGRKYTSITFKIQSQAYQQKFDFTDENAELFEKLVNTCKLRKDQAKKVLENFTENEIKTKMRDIKIDTADGKVTNVGGYSAKLFNVQ